MIQATTYQRMILEKIANRITRPGHGGTFRRMDSTAIMLSRSATMESSLDDDFSNADDELDGLYRDLCEEAGEGPHPKHKTYPV